MTDSTEKRPLILMTGSADISQRGLRRMYYYKNYPEALEAHGAVVLQVSHCDPASARQLAQLADGLYLSGGGDIAPGCYGETPHPLCGEAEEGRDQLEFILGKAFLDAKKPVLGICRGLQVLNVLLGGTLWQDISDQTGLAHPNDSVHRVKTAEGSLFRSLFGAEFPVNSYHHQAVRDLAPGLVPEAWDESGRLIEAFSHEALPIWAAQWHPERMTGRERLTREGPDMAPLFQFFCEECHSRKK